MWVKSFSINDCENGPFEIEKKLLIMSIWKDSQHKIGIEKEC